MAEPSSAFRLPRLEIAKVVALAAAQAVTLGAFLLLLRFLFDAMAAGPVDHQRVLRTIWVLVGVILLNASARGLEFIVSETMGYELVRGLRMRMYRHMQGMTPRQIQGRSRGGLLLRFTGDLSMLRTWISRGLARGLVSLMVLMGVVGVIAYLNVRLAVTIAGVLLLGAAALAQLGPRLRQLTRRVRRQRSLLTSNTAEQVNALAVVQVSGRSGGEHDRFSHQNDSMTRSLFRTTTVRGSMLGISSATGWLTIAGVLLVGAWELAAGNTSVGTVVAAVIACRQLTGPVRRLGLSYDYWQRSRVSRQKLLDFLGSSSRPLDDPNLDGLRLRRGQIEFHDVTVAGSLRGVNATVAGGRVVAIVGPTGAGKSTLLNVVAGLVDPDDGEVVVDGQPLSERTLRSRFRRVGMVAADLPLMRGTVRRNLTYRKPSATNAELQRVIMACRLDELIAELPAGLDTWLNEAGNNLSVGQRQRLALGRALLGNPWILLLDEPTMNLDDANTEIFRRVIGHHQGTVLLVTHDADLASLADEVWLMDDGRVADTVPGDEFRDRQWNSTRPAALHAS